MMAMPRMATDQDKEGIRKLWKICFLDSDRFIDWFFEHRFAAEYTACIEEDGEIVSAMQSYPLHMRLRHTILPAAIIAGVSTHPKHSGKGYMGAMFKFYMHEIRNKGIVLTPHTPANLPTFFSRGHYPVSDTAHLNIEHAKAASPCPNTQDICAQDMLPRLYACYVAGTSSYSGIISRSLSDFALKIEDYLADGGKCLVHLFGGTVLGYCIYYSMEQSIHVEEFIAKEPNIRNSLLHALMVRADGRDVHVKLPPDTTGLSIPGASLSIRPQGVLGVANVSMLLKMMFDTTEYVVSIEDKSVPENDGVFDFTGERTDRPPHFSLSAGRLAQLLCGYKTLEQLTGEQLAVQHDEAACERISSLLPKQTCFIIDEY